ncbi:MAG: zf-HC2 domain-containing protein [Chloroflexia bacterium]
MGKTYNNNEINGEGHVHDLLSTYIDKSLEEPERVRVRAHLEECVDCRADYVELQATSRMLQQMPIVAVPRAFILTPEMVKGARKTYFWERIFAPRTAPTFASGAIVAFGLLIFLAVTSTFATSAKPPLSTAFYQASPQDTIRSSATSDPGSSTGEANTMAEPTTPTEAAEAPNVSASKQSATPPSDAGDDTAMSPPVPADTPAPAVGQGGYIQPGSLITPNTQIASSGNSSPTTVALSTDTQTTDGTTQDNTAGSSPANDVTDNNVQPQPIAVQAPIAQTFDPLLTVEIGLLVIGLVLAGAYLFARRR